MGNDVIHCMFVGCNSFIPFSIPYQKEKGPPTDDLNNISIQEVHQRSNFTSMGYRWFVVNHNKKLVFYYILLTIGAHLENRFGADGQNHRVVKGGGTLLLQGYHIPLIFHRQGN